MSLKSVARKVFSLTAKQILILLVVFQLLMTSPVPLRADEHHGGGDNSSDTRTPIKHVIVIIGENRTFDHIFATYEPKDHQKVWNLLSEGIVNEDGTPGPNYSRAAQFSAVDSSPSPFEMSPMSKTIYPVLPVPLAGGAKTPPFSSVGAAEAVENGLETSPFNWYTYLTTGGTGLTGGTPDTRTSYDGFDVFHLPSGPYQLTPGVAYDDYAASPVHRFYQMWQQLDCNAVYSTEDNPSGCKADLFPWVELTIGAGSNGKAPGTRPYDSPSGEGATAMGFYNMAQGDAPYLKFLADNYAMSDNFHQAVEGGTGANHVMLGTGDAIWFSDGKGNAAVPPSNQIEDPDPLTGTNNWYTQDGYSGGTYSDCADTTQKGVPAVVSYLQSLARPINPNCEFGHYYLLNNYNPGYYGNGTVAYGDPLGTPFTIPPSTLRTIGDELLEANISWKYYGDGWNNYVANPHNPADTYCNICNFEQYATSIMTNPGNLAHLQDTANLYTDIADGSLPAVSFVKPSGLLDGHPASSKLDLFEGFVKKIVDGVQANPDLWKDTAIFVTVDEGGGYWDSGYVQPLDFFGDGTRIPLIVVSPFTKAGHISHDYADHVSILKFIEANWELEPVTGRSRDNFPNPVADHDNPYVPKNSPAISDLMGLFDFHHGDGDHDHDDGGH
jgi:phospholipase C